MDSNSLHARSSEAVCVGSIVIRCHRFEAMAEFWMKALGYAPREASEDGWVVLTDPSGNGPNISLDRVDEPLAPGFDELSPIHLDLYTADQETEVERLLGLGATLYAQPREANADFVVLVDPDGYRFCVVQKLRSSG